MRPFDENDDFQVKDRTILAGVLINSDFLNGLEAPDNSVIETIKILEEKNLEKNKLIIV